MEQTSTITPLGLFCLAVMAVAMWALPRRYAIVPLLITTCYIPIGQMFIVAGLHFKILRVLLLIGAARVCVRREWDRIRFGRPDQLFLYWSVVTLVMGAILGKFITRAGDAYDALGAYFLFRCWISDTDDVIAGLRFLAWMILPLAFFMAVEGATNHNVFSVFGGVPFAAIQRDASLRCQGAFAHPILAGTYSATLLPVFVGLWFWPGKNKVPAMVGGGSAAFATIASHSSGPLLAMLSAIISFAVWRMRDQMRVVRWALLGIIGGFALIMNAPVWYLIARLSDLVGGTGWHRSYLIDVAYRHFYEWWLVGSTYTAHWAPGGQVLAVDPNNMDITNQYIAEGLAGGVLRLGLFIAIIVTGFKTVGRVLHKRDTTFAEGILVWSFGASLSSHCMSFFSVSYFDQIIVMWFWLLAILAMFAGRAEMPARVSRQRFSPEPQPAIQKRQHANALGI